MEEDGHRTFFFRMEGGHLVNANQLVQTPIDIDQRVYNAIQLIKRCPPTPNKENIRSCAQKEDHFGTQTFKTNNNFHYEQRGIFPTLSQQTFYSHIKHA